ncbi:MAG: hypothetical protein KIIPBIDF_01732 [Candidatus Methanoperedenaceae archaeon GB50]|nr:hypothetical protein BLFGPEAP_00896 [Candidatus Methanoperedenaceae archaeon GB50]CAD7782642.1 MAG: hypothetical protein KIIPBIDF_01732 [Candidatus Methanoperedenaceae archaeon GB50]
MALSLVKKRKNCLNKDPKCRIFFIHLRLNENLYAMDRQIQPLLAYSS